MPTPRKNPLPPVNIDTEPVGKRIAKTRKRRGFTQTQLAEKIGITQTVVSDYEIGRLRISDEILIRLSVALKVSTDYLLGLEGSDETEPISRTLASKMVKIEKLPQNEKRALLKSIDMYLKGSENTPTKGR
jgi:transcriptional regulator with XRE-family HTH domain